MKKRNALIWLFMLFWAADLNAQNFCDGTIYFSTISDAPGGGTNIYTIDPYTYEVILLKAFDTWFNALGFNPQDRHLYALRSGEILRISLGGDIEAVIPVPGIAPGGIWAGTFDAEGVYLLTGSNPLIYRIRIDGNTATILDQSTKFYANPGINGLSAFGDIVFDPTSNRFYGMDLNTQSLVTFEPSTGEITTIGEENGIDQYFGAMYTQVDGHLRAFLFEELYAIDKGNGSLDFLAEGPPVIGGIDACNCPFYPDLFQSVEPVDVCAGDTFSIQFTFYNNTSDTLDDLTFVDTLPKPLVLATPPDHLFGGALALGLDYLMIEGMTFPPGVATFSMTVAVPPDIAEDTIFYNQASLGGLPPEFPSLLLSDERTTEWRDDPSPLLVHPQPVWTDLSLPTMPFCLGDTAQLTASANTDGNYLWQGPSGIATDVSELIVYPVGPEHVGTYQVAFENEWACGIDTLFELEMHPIPDLGLVNDTSICLREPYTLRANDFLNYKWQDGSDRSYLLVEEYGRYTLEVVDENNCRQRDTVELSSACPADLYIPNVFSPNGDGANDHFYAYGHELIAFQLQVFNRWGAVLFESDDLLSGWDGNFKGQAMPIGVYTYWIEASFLNGQTTFFSGDILLLR